MTFLTIFIDLFHSDSRIMQNKGSWAKEKDNDWERGGGEGGVWIWVWAWVSSSYRVVVGTTDHPSRGILYFYHFVFIHHHPPHPCRYIIHPTCIYIYIYTYTCMHALDMCPGAHVQTWGSALQFTQGKWILFFLKIIFFTINNFIIKFILV